MFIQLKNIAFISNGMILNTLGYYYVQCILFIQRTRETEKLYWKIKINQERMGLLVKKQTKRQEPKNDIILRGVYQGGITIFYTKRFKLRNRFSLRKQSPHK